MARTQSEVIDDLTEQTLARLRGLEEEKVEVIIKAYQEARDDIAKYLNVTFREVVGSGGGNWSLAQMRTYDRDQKLFGEINQRLAQLADQVNEKLEDGFVSQFDESKTATNYVLDQATPQDVEVKDPKIPEHAVRSLSNAEFEGAMFSQRVGMITDAMASDIRDQLTQSMINGESMDEAASRVGAVIGAEDAEAVDSFAYRALTIARTEIMRAQDLGREAVYAENLDLMKATGSTWMVTPDDRLCPWCLKREGLTRDQIAAKTRNDKQFAGKTEKPLHPHCRCTSAPALKSWKELTGLDMPEKYGDDVRGFRDPTTGKWSIAPVKSFDEWKAEKLSLSGV